MTSGGAAGTNGSGRARRIAWLAFAVVGGLYASVNAMSVIADRAGLGRPVPAWEPWSWEMTSFATWLTIAPLIFAAAERLRPPRLTWPTAIGFHLLLSLAASIAHVGIMIGLREAIYASAGSDYRQAGGLADILVYEYRKDAITYALLAASYLLVRRLAAPDRSAPRPDGHRIEVRDSARTIYLDPSDVEWAQAAGNYVELHGAFGLLLHRITLAALERELEAHGFRRIHRSRIVRADAVRAVTTRPSGDFDVDLESGARLLGSRRFRARLQGP